MSDQLPEPTRYVLPDLDSVRTIDEGTKPPATTLDPLAAWRALTPAVQEQLGAAAIAAEVGTLGTSIAHELAVPEAARPREVAANEARTLVFELVVIHVLQGDERALPPRPDLRPLGIRQCRECGCTDEFTCDGGCHWVEADLCSACTTGADHELTADDREGMNWWNALTEAERAEWLRTVKTFGGRRTATPPRAWAEHKRRRTTP